MSSSYRIALEEWLKQLDVKADKVLDIGGAQLPVKGRTRTWNVGYYKIADLPEPHVNSPKPDLELDLNENYPLMIGEYEEKYNLIFCLEVFEYVYRPVVAMERIKSFLKTGGSAWVTFPFIYPLHNPVENDYLRYTETMINKLAELSGLTIEEMIPRYAETNAIENMISAERLRGAKGYEHDILGWIVRFKK